MAKTSKKNPLETFKVRYCFEDGKDGIPIDFNNPEHVKRLNDWHIRVFERHGYKYVGKSNTAAKST